MTKPTSMVEGFARSISSYLPGSQVEAVREYLAVLFKAGQPVPEIRQLAAQMARVLPITVVAFGYTAALRAENDTYFFTTPGGAQDLAESLIFLLDAKVPARLMLSEDHLKLFIQSLIKAYENYSDYDTSDVIKATAEALRVLGIPEDFMGRAVAVLPCRLRFKMLLMVFIYHKDWMGHNTDLAPDEAEAYMAFWVQKNSSLLSLEREKNL